MFIEIDNTVFFFFLVRMKLLGFWMEMENGNEKKFLSYFFYKTKRGGVRVAGAEGQEQKRHVHASEGRCHPQGSDAGSTHYSR